MRLILMAVCLIAFEIACSQPQMYEEERREEAFSDQQICKNSFSVLLLSELQLWTD